MHVRITSLTRPIVTRPVLRQPHFEIFRDKSAKQWRWRLVAGNGEKIATSGEGYASYHNALRAANRVKELVPAAYIKTLTPMEQAFAQIA
ncbi:YegP family protein [Tahibacter harae]|uniref:YegP family protein n=1 Tax=Tahibacter harae TaxID=2963937 RepID=UPI00272EC026|nr:DUF1508 domain-containing protein [Tahibacter harae]